MRIVGGNHRGRRLAAPAGRDVRPTGDRTREALFNIIAHHGDFARALEGGVVLDAFCGSGALALEALSRGAARAVLMDIARPSLDAARANADSLGEGARVTLLRADATRPPAAVDSTRPPAAAGACTLAFLDPPYGKGLAGRALPALARAGWLAPDCLMVVEEAADAPWATPPGFAVLDERRYGDTILRFIARRGAETV